MSSSAAARLADVFLNVFGHHLSSVAQRGLLMIFTYQMKDINWYQFHLEKTLGLTSEWKVKNVTSFETFSLCFPELCAVCQQSVNGREQGEMGGSTTGNVSPSSSKTGFTSSPHL